MALEAADIEYRLPRTISDAGTNGGICSYRTLAASAEDSPWESVPPSDLEAGAVQYRKAFWRIANADDLPLSKAARYLHRPTPGEDHIHICAGTHDDIQSDISGGSPDWYGSAPLNASVLAGATEVEVSLEDPAVTIFRDGDLIHITNKATPSAGTGTEEWRRVDGAPTLDGSVLTIQLSTPLTYGYSNAVTWVSSCLEATGIAGAVEDVVVTSAAGMFDESDVQVHGKGSYYETITLSFTSSTAFTASSDQDGTLGSGSIAAGISPDNLDTGTKRFTIDPSAFGGTFANGDEITFLVVPPELAHWERRTIPEGCGSLASNSRTMVLVRR